MCFVFPRLPSSCTRICVTMKAWNPSLQRKLSQHDGGRNISAPLRTAFMRRIRKGGQNYAAHLVIGQRIITAQLWRTGSELSNLSPDEKGVLFKLNTGFLDFETQPFGYSVRLALLSPSFLSSSPGSQEAYGRDRQGDKLRGRPIAERENDGNPLGTELAERFDT